LSFGGFPLIHLWFLYLLGLFYLALALLHPFLGARTFTSTKRFLLHVLIQPWAVVLLAAPLCLSLYLHPYWMMWFGIPTPDRSFVPNLPAVIGYGGAFAFGWLVQHKPDTLDILQRR
jgi:peptidoglycan/LPS O-acetylase OafA/YrhL